MPGVEVDWEGLDTLQSIVTLGPHRVAEAGMDQMVDVAYAAFAESQRQVPVATGVLRASGSVSVEENEIDIGYGGAAASYALWVHEDMAARHKPPTKAKYLEDPVNQQSALLEPDLAGVVEAAIVGTYPQQASIAQGASMGASVRKALSDHVKSRGRSKQRKIDILHPRAMTDREIHRALKAIDHGRQLERQGKGHIREFYRAGP